LFSSRTRHDAHGEVVPLHEEDVDHHAPLVTMLRYGRRLRERRLKVGLRVSFTEVGTLELWFESRDTPHRWQLQFELRGEPVQSRQEIGTQSHTIASSFGDTNSDLNITSALNLIRNAFINSADDDGPETLVSQLETTLGRKREAWPVAAIRRFAETLIEVAAGRKQSPRHEMRWLNLAGFCLRPGIGVPGDDVRVKNLLTIASNELTFANELQCQVALLVLLRRIAGGVPANAQLGLFRKLTNPIAKHSRPNQQVEYERLRLLASLEHLLASTRTSFGEKLLAKIKKEPENPIYLWSLRRLGARIPLYGPLHSVVPAQTAGEWLRILLDLPLFTAATQAAILQLARRTDDRSRDLDDALRAETIDRLAAHGVADDSIRLLATYIAPERMDAVRSFGESLPPGLQVISSPNCLLSVPALLP